MGELNKNAQGYRYQQRVNKYKLAHIAAGGDGWADRLRAEVIAKQEAAKAAEATVVDVAMVPLDPAAGATGV